MSKYGETCKDCYYWYGRCSRKNRRRKDVINRVASSAPCEDFERYHDLWNLGLDNIEKLTRLP